MPTIAKGRYSDEFHTNPNPNSNSTNLWSLAPLKLRPYGTIQTLLLLTIISTLIALTTNRIQSNPNPTNPSLKLNLTLTLTVALGGLRYSGRSPM